MKAPFVLRRSPARENIKLHIERITASCLSDFSCLDWILQGLQEEKCNFPVTLIFTRTITACGEIFSHFVRCLRDKAFLCDNRKSSTRIIAMFYSSTSDKKKKEIMQDLTSSNPHFRVVICTNALGLGVSINCIENIVHFGCPRSIEDYAQEVGRAGRLGNFSKAFLYYSSVHFIGADGNIKDFVKNNEKCRRLKLLEYFPSTDVKKPSVSPLHCCCDICSNSCKCKNCNSQRKASKIVSEITPIAVRNTDADSYNLFSTILIDLQKKYSECNLPFTGELVSDQLVQDLLGNVYQIDSFENLIHNFDIFHPKLALDIFYALKESFDEDTEIPTIFLEKMNSSVDDELSDKNLIVHLLDLSFDENEDRFASAEDEDSIQCTY